MLEELDKKVFDENAEKFACKNFFQTSEMGSYLESKNKKVYYLGLKINEEIVALAMLSERYKFLGKIAYQCLKGFLVDYKNSEIANKMIEELKSFINNHNGFKLYIDPYIVAQERDKNGDIVENGVNNLTVINNLKSVGFEKCAHDMQVTFNFCLGLEGKTKEEIFGNFKPNTRNRINKAQRKGVEVLDIEYKDLDRFKKITEYTSKKRGFADKSLDYYQKMYELFGNQVVFKMAILNVKKYLDELKIMKNDYEIKLKDVKNNKAKESQYLAELENTNNKIKKAMELKASNGDFIDIACGMFMLYGEETIYLFSGSLDEFNDFEGQYLIQWEIIKYAIENNKKRHNFFGIINFDNPNHPEYGIYSFKKSFDGYVEELIGEYKFSTNGIISALDKLKRKGD